MTRFKGIRNRRSKTQSLVSWRLAKSRANDVPLLKTLLF
jgi:hypothetical protein